MGKFWHFGLVVAYRRWLLLRSGHTWKFDCIKQLHSVFVISKIKSRLIEISSASAGNSCLDLDCSRDPKNQI